MTLEHRSCPTPFSAAAPRPSLRHPARHPSICAANTVSNSLLLCIFTQMSADSAFDNAPVLNGMHISKNMRIAVKVLFFSMLRTLFALSIRQLSYCQSFAHSCFTLLHKSEDQVFYFHSRAHSFVKYIGVCISENSKNLKCYFCFASHSRHSALHSTAVIARASSRRLVNGTAEPPKEPQWS